MSSVLAPVLKQKIKTSKMENNLTYYLTLFWGSYLILGSIILLLLPTLKSKILSILKVDSDRIILGIALSIVGLLHISFHNIWTLDISLVITLIGWICFLKGIMLIINRYWGNVANSVLESNYFGFVLLFMICLGIYLIQVVNPLFKF